MTEIPKSHPRYASLKIRERITEGVTAGITSIQGLIAQGRGEAFDYLIGERTTSSAFVATKLAAAMLLLAKKPALSVNGNVAALVPEEMVTLSNELKAPLEINLFHRTEERVAKISELLTNLGGERILGEKPDTVLPGLDHARSKATRGGIIDADVVLIPLEDGDRCETLIKMGKNVIAVDLNPLSRTARTAKLAIVDNIVRAMPNLIILIRELSGESTKDLQDLLQGHDNNELLRQALFEIQKNLDRQIEIEIPNLARIR